MTKPVTNGGPAFPQQGHLDGYTGLTVRDYFAARATEYDIEKHRTYDHDKRDYDRTREQARYAYADAMIVARGEQGGAP